MMKNEGINWHVGENPVDSGYYVTTILAAGKRYIHTDFWYGLDFPENEYAHWKIDETFASSYKVVAWTYYSPYNEYFIPYDE